MSEWKSRATPVPNGSAAAAAPTPSSGWRSRAAPVPAPAAAAALPDESSFGDAFVNSFGNTFGTANTIGAGIQADLKGLANIPKLARGEMTPMENLRSIYDEFQKARGENKYISKRDMETQKGASIGGRLLGGILTAPISGVGSGVKAAATIGAAQGAVEGASESEATDAAGVLTDAATGAALGGVFSGAGQKIGNEVAKRLPAAADAARDWLEDTAAVQALKAAGAKAKDLTSIAKRDPGQIREMGRSLLDEDVLRPFMGVEQVEHGLAVAKEGVGDAMGGILRQVDEAGGKFDMGRFIKRAEQEIIAPNLNDPAVAREVESVRQFLDAYRTAAASKPIDFQRANHLKSSLQNAQINWGNHWNNNGPSKYLEQFKVALQGIMKDEIDTQLGEAASPAVRAEFEALKKRFGPLAFATDRARQGVAREMGNDAIGLKDMQAAQMGLQTALSSGQASPTGLAMAAGSAFLNKYLTGRGSSAVAVGADRLASSDWLERLVQASPEALGEYGGVLASALARGPAALAARDYVLSQKDPNYRQKKEAAQKAATGQQ